MTGRISKDAVLNLLDFRAYYQNELKQEIVEDKEGWSKLVLCPFHADQNRPNLTVNTRHGGFKCHACGAKGSVIDFQMQRHAMNFREALEELARRAGIEVDVVKKKKPKAASRIVATYDYLTAAGELAFQVCRFDEPKTFAQRQPIATGFTWNMAGVELVPYHLPEVQKADTVYIPEGEKDADRLRDLNLTATTFPMGAGKYRPAYNCHFVGKHVVILPDNDPPGRDHAQTVARNLHGVAASVKILELPGLPDKGDVSDWGGTVDELLRLVEAAPLYAPDPLARTSYTKKNGRLCYLKTVSTGKSSIKVPEPLCNFEAHCSEEIIRDDGRERVREYNLEGTLDTGLKLPPISVKANEFSSMGWIDKYWGMAANLEAGTANKDQVRAAIKHLSKHASQRTIFSHTGWRKIDVWVYLHGGGAIGTTAAIEVDLGPDLSRYTLPPPGGQEAAQASLDLLDIAPLIITAALLAFCYLAPPMS